MAVVLLAALVSGSKNMELIAGVTKLPFDFVLLVLGMADRVKVFDQDVAYEIQRAVKDNQDFDEILDYLNELLEDFLGFRWRDEVEHRLDKFRTGRKLLGTVDDWVEAELLPKKRRIA
jgi:hypothetical protein